tara:strand:- start:209 stop:463 length:255 start_codon:yes stop_codon:yes gene_type:complete
MKTSLRESIHSNDNRLMRKFLIYLRKSLELSQRGLAEKMGVSRSYIGKVEVGDRRLDYLEFKKYLEFLNSNINEFERYLKKCSL